MVQDDKERPAPVLIGFDLSRTDSDFTSFVIFNGTKRVGLHADLATPFAAQQPKDAPHGR